MIDPRFAELAIDKCPDAAFWMGPDAAFVYVNEAACQVLGYTRDELLGMSVHDIDPDFPAAVWEQTWLAVKERRLTTFRSHHRTKDGRTFPVEITTNYFDLDGQEYNCAFARDISKNVHAEEERAFLLQETQRRSDELSALLDVTASASRSLEVAKVLDEVIRKITEIFHFDATGIYLSGLEEGTLELRAAFERKADTFAPARTLRSDKGISAHVMQTNDAFLAEDVRYDPLYDRMSQTKVALEQGFRFFAIFPIRSRTDTIGVVVCMGQEVRRLTEQEQRLIMSMMDQIGVAVENAKLFEAMQARTNELSALSAVAIALNQSLDLNQLFQNVTHQVLEIFDFDAARIYLFDEAENGLLLVAHEGFPPHLILPARYELTGNIMATVFETAEPFLCEDARESAELIRMSPYRTLISAGYRGMFFIPVVSKDRSVGVMNFVSQRPHGFSAYEAELIQSLASNLGVAVENSRLFMEITKKAVELQQLNVELASANRIRSDFMNAMSHELRTPLNVTVGYVGLLLDGFGGSVTETQRETLETIRHQCHTLFKVINDVLTSARLEAGKVRLTITHGSVGEVIQHVKSYVLQLQPKEGLEFAWQVDEHLPAIATDHLKLEQILQNLIGNAYKFTSEGTIAICVRDVANEKRVEFDVSDTGVGIDEGDLGRIFEQFHQGPEAHTGPLDGLGLGLSIVKTYLDRMNGAIAVRSRIGVGTVFTVSVPYAIEAED